MVEETNRVEISGTVIMINSGRRLSVVQIVSDGGNGKKSFPRFLFRNPEETAGFKVGDRVTVTGHLHSRIQRNSKREVTGRSQELIADEIVFMNRMLLNYFEFDDKLEKEGGFPPDKNVALVAGKVTHIYSPRPDITILTVAVSDGKVINQCEVTCFMRQSETAQQFEEEDIIAAAGYIQTAIKEKDGGRVYYQSMTARDVAKV